MSNELLGIAEYLEWLKASEKSFAFWDNPKDTIDDNL
jgi:hypothetical protein